MTPVEADSLVRRIAEFLKDPADESQVAALAHAYAEECRLVNQRLDQCAAILAAGDPQQALQLAEAPTPLLDLVTLLAFREARAWRAHCQAHELPVPPTFPEKTVRQLNALCASGSARQHAAYADYRTAMFRRDDLAALAALRVIAHANPADSNALQELPKVEERIRQAALGRLQQLVDRQDAPAVAAELERIEALLLSSPPRGGVWIEAQRLRCRHLIRQLTELHEEDAGESAAALLEWIESLRDQHRLDLPPEDSREIDRIRVWIGQQREAAAVSASCEEAVSGITRQLDASAEQWRSARSRSLGDLRGCLGSLTRLHEELARLGRSLPDSLQPRFDQVVRSLNFEIHRRTRRRRNAALGAVTLLAVLAAGFGALHLARFRAEQLASSLDRMVAAREVVSADRLLARIHSSGPSPDRWPALQAAVLSGQSLVDRERQLKDGFDAILNRLAAAERDGFGSVNPASVEEQARLAEERWAELAADFQGEAKTRLLSFRHAWEAHLHEARAERDDIFRRHLAQAEERAACLRYEAGPEEVQECLMNLRPVLDQLGTLAAAESASLRLAPALSDRYATIAARSEGFAREVEAWDTFQPLLRRPVSLESHLAAVEWARDAKFIDAAPARAAMDMLSFEPSLANLVLGLLFPGLSEVPPQDLLQEPLSLSPAKVLEAERLLWTQLCDDEIIHRLRRCELRVLSPGGGTLSRRFVWSKGTVDGSPGLTQAGSIYDPWESRTAVVFRRHVYRRSEAEIHDLGAASESAAFARAGLSDLIDGATGRYRRPMLQCLDLLNTETEASPVFRAFVALRLHRLMEFQPDAWGLAWAPAARAHRQRLIELGAGEIQSGDWLVPDVNDRLAARLEDHFRLARQFSYVRQAIRLQPAIRHALREGFSFAGFVDASGHLVLADPRLGPRELWGWRKDTRAPGRVLRAESTGIPHGPVAAALPWTPVFAFRGEISAILRPDAAWPSAEEAAMRPYLPPLFQPPS